MTPPSHPTPTDGREPAVRIRPAEEADCAAVADIYRHYVEHTVATFDTVPRDPAGWASKLADVRAARRPFLVAERDGEIVGFAYLGRFRDHDAYARTVEDTVYVRDGAGRGGIGSALMSALVDAADPANVAQIIAVIAATGGEGSVRLHERFGFVEVGRLRRVGHKFGQWIDCIYMQKQIS